MRAHAIVSAIAVSLVFAGPGYAQTAAPDPHHLAGQPTAAPSPAMPSPPKVGNGAQGSMMGSLDMGRMMSMMHGHTMMAGTNPRHIEGRIAFLRAELKITRAQDVYWSRYADALRANANSGRSPMPSMMMSGAMTSMPAPDTISRQEQTLVTSLAAVRAVKGALIPLYQALTDDQKKIADELLVSPMGLM
jgi:hypothetical protein